MAKPLAVIDSEQEFETTFLDVKVTVSFIDYGESLEITGCRVTGTDEEINTAEVQVRKYKSVEFVTGEKYLEGEAGAYLAGLL